MNLTRKIFSPILIIIYLISINGNLISLAEYLIRFDYIVKNLCIQKNEIKNTCKGSCHLEQNLNKVNDSKSENSKSVKLKLLVSLDFHQTQTNPLFIKRKKNCEFIVIQDERERNQTKIKPEIPPPKVINILNS